MSHRITLRRIEPVTHDTYRLVLDRPEGYDFTQGQATDVALDRDGWRDDTRPFTFTSQPEDDHLEFIIKTYPEHEGVTREIASLAPGEAVHVGAPWGAIRDAGPGTFIAGGAGVTPFIPILRRRHRDGTLAGCHLIFANKSADDIILRKEWEQMEDLRATFPVDSHDPVLPRGPVDADLLERFVGDFGGLFYFCGPPPMRAPVMEALGDHGVGPSQIVEEDKPGEYERARLFAA
jgi:hypothetical protein